MNDQSDSTDLGPWSNDNFSETTRLVSGVGADSDLPDHVRFLAGVAKLIKRRLMQQATETDPSCPAVFLLKPTFGKEYPTISPRRVPMLDNGVTVVTGRLWFVSPVVVNGYYIDIESYDDDQLFLLVTDEIKLGDVPAVVFDPRPKVPEVRFYPKGLMDVENYQKVNFYHSNISLESIFEIINLVYENCLVTPEAQEKAGKLWKDHSKYIPVSEAEGMVQLHLRIGLTVAFPTCTVRHEQTDVPGRLDLEIEEADQFDRSNIKRHAILELKVLRSYWSTGDTVSEKEILDWVEKGVIQAAAYRDKRGALTSALCCFDMRNKETGVECFAHVTETAKKLSVVMKLWFIYAKSELYRRAVTMHSS